MKVVCITNKGSDLPDSLLDDRPYNKKYEFNLTVGQTYVVCSACTRSGGSLYYFLRAEWEYSYPAELFDIIDPRISTCWIVGQDRSSVLGAKPKLAIIWGYPEEATDNDHRGAVCENKKEAVALFHKYRRFMELEFPDPTDPHVALEVQDGRLQCPSCGDSWQDALRLGRVQCPNCKQMMNNPHYRPGFDPAILSAL